MKTPNAFHDEETNRQAGTSPEKINTKRHNLLAPLLLAFPVIFIIIALTKVLASEDYVSQPLERESISWKLPVDSSASQTDTIK